MASASISSEGQVVIPKEIRDYLKLAAGSKVDFVIDDAGQVKIIPLHGSVAALSGILHQPGRAAATLEEMESAIQQGASL